MNVTMKINIQSVARKAKTCERSCAIKSETITLIFDTFREVFNPCDNSYSYEFQYDIGNRPAPYSEMKINVNPSLI
jgi:hypothetical protein